MADPTRVLLSQIGQASAGHLSKFVSLIYLPTVFCTSGRLWTIFCWQCGLTSLAPDNVPNYRD